MKSERTAKVTLDIVTQQLAAGQVNYLALLSAQQTYQQALSNLAPRYSRLADTAALFQALGGGWWNRPNVSAP